MGKKVAILGAGVSGLVAAYELYLKGYQVEVFEKEGSVGGKFLTQELDGRSFELGAVGVPQDLCRTIKSLCAAIDIDLPFSVANASSAEEKSASIPFLATHNPALKRLMAFLTHEIGFHQYPRAEDPLYDILLDSLPSFVRKTGWVKHDSLLEGYCADESTPVLPMIKLWIEMGTVNPAAFHRFEHSLREFLVLLAAYLTGKGVKLNLNTSIRNIDRHESGVSLVFSEEKKEFNHLVISCPSKDILDDVLITATSIETKLISAIRYRHYATAIIEFNIQPTTHAKDNSGGYLLGEEEIGKGHFYTFIFPYENTPIAIFHISSPTRDMSQESIVAAIETDMRKRCGEHLSIVKVHFYNHWDYLPHYNVDNMREGYYQLFHSIQGENRTYYCGGLFNGDTAESCACFARYLVHSFFKDLDPLSLLPPHLIEIEERIIKQKNAFIRLHLEKTPTVLHSLQTWSNEIPTQNALAWYEKGRKRHEITYGQLWKLILHHANEIRKTCQNYHKGDRIVLLFEPCLEFFLNFYACLLNNMIAVPYYSPSPSDTQKGIDLLTKVLVNTESKYIIMSSRVMTLKTWKGKWPLVLNGKKILYFTVPSLPLDNHFDAKQIYSCPNLPSSHDIAFLQFTSGSTGDPKGVVIGHDNFQYHSITSGYFMIQNQMTGEMMKGTETIATSWLPQYHDMGLALSVTTMLFLGGTCHLMSPFDFLGDPLVWFDIMSATKSTHSVAPNFSYGLVTRKWDRERATQWDLSAVRMLGNSSEPILHGTVTSFLDKMKSDVPSFPSEVAFLPGYGMSECVASNGMALFGSSLILSDTHESSAPLIASVPNVRYFDGFAIISCEEGEDPHILEEGKEGEIWISSPGVAHGYWNNPLLTNEIFHNFLPFYDGANKRLSVVNNTNANNFWLRTGDLGFMQEGHLFITGRKKDLIIVNGRNIYPQDLEYTVSQIDSSIIRPGCIVAFSVRVEDTEGYVIVAELRESFVRAHRKGESKGVYAPLIQQIEQRLKSEFPGDIIQILLTKEKTIPKTTSGKLKRRAIGQRWKNGEISPNDIIFQHPEIVKDNLVFNASRKISAIDQEEDKEYLLLWVQPAVERIMQAFHLGASHHHHHHHSHHSHFREETISIEFYTKMCLDLCEKFHIYDQEVELVHQGLDSLKIFELAGLINDFHVNSSSSSKSSLATINVADINVLFEWTGNDLIYAICGVPPPDKDRSRPFFLLSPHSYESTLQFSSPSLPTLFMFHSLNGYATSYKMIEDTLTSEYKVFGVNSPNLFIKDEKDMVFYETFQDLAVDYVKRIREISPTGPYHVGGYCLGGTIAMHVARLLQSEGEEVKSVILIDSHFHSQFKERYFPTEFEMIFQTLLANIGVVEKVERIIKNSFHMQNLYFDSLSDPNIRLSKPIDKVYIIHGQGYLTNLIHQKKSGLMWEFGDVFDGNSHFFHPDQGNIHIGVGFSGNLHLLFKPYQKKHINEVLNDIFNEEDDLSFHVRNLRHNLIVAIKKKSLFLFKMFLHQTDGDDNGIGRDLLYDTNYQDEGNTLLHIAVQQQAYEIANYLLKETHIDENHRNIHGLTAFENLPGEMRPELVLKEGVRGLSVSSITLPSSNSGVGPLRRTNSSHYRLIPSASNPFLDSFDIEQQREVDEKKEWSSDFKSTKSRTNEEYISEATDDYHKNHKLNLSRLLHILREKITRSFLCKSISILLQQSPAILVTYVIGLTYRLLLFRFISSSSSAVAVKLLAASVLDDSMFSLALATTEQLATPMLNHIIVAFDSNQPKEVGNVFDSTLLLAVVPIALLLVLFCAIAQQIGDGIGIESDVVHEWSLLAFAHILGIVPFLCNVVMERLTNLLSHRQAAAWGGLVEGGVGLIVFLLCQHYLNPSDCNGLALGFALSAGHWSKFLFYLVLYHSCFDFFQRFSFFSFSSLRLSSSVFPSPTMRRLWADVSDKSFTPLFLFSNSLVIILLISSQSHDSAWNLIGFAIGNFFYRIVNIAGSVMSLSSSLISF